jgi:FkbM family methyltransferase
MAIDIEAVKRFLETAGRDVGLYNSCRDYAFRFDGDNNWDSYRNGEVRTLRALIPGCRVVFDVGANRGDWTELVLTLNPALELHAFEPAAASFRVLAGKRLPPAVRINNFGLGDREEQRTLYQLGPHAESELRSLYRREGLEADMGLVATDPGEQVRIATLDGYCAANGVTQIDYLKIDTEGHDLRVLRGAQALVARRAIRFIQFEFGAPNIESRDLLQDFFGFFAGSGYQLHKITADGYLPYARYSPLIERFDYQNWLAVDGASGVGWMRAGP